MIEAMYGQERLVDLGGGLEIWRVPVAALKEQDENARAMNKECFERLTMTVARDRRLESLPFCATTERGIEIISGHHRTRSAAAAGLVDIHVIVDVTGLSKDQIKAKQLAHNSIQGDDDAQMLARIFSGIDSAESRLEAFIRAEDLDLPKTSLDDFALVIDVKTVGLMFMPRQFAKFEEALERLRKQYDAIYVADEEQFRPFREVINRVAKDYDVRNVAVMVAKMCDIVNEHMGAPPDDSAEFIALRDIFGTATVPFEIAEMLGEVIETLKREGHITRSNRWMALAYLAQNFPFTRHASE